MEIPRDKCCKSVRLGLGRTGVPFSTFGALFAFHCLLAQNPATVPGDAGVVANDAPQAGQTPVGGANNNFTGGGAGTFPARPPGDKAAVGRGKKAYETNCEYCHGEDARGGDNGGTNIIRSDYLMRDRDGEILRTFLLNKTGTGHTGSREGMLKFDFTKSQASDIASYVTDLAAYIHEFKVSSRDPGRMRPPTIVVGDAKAGEVFFSAHCASCHSLTGDMKGIATRIPDPRTLQQTWIMPRVYGGRGGRAASDIPVTVTLATGEKVEGRLGKLDDFIVVLADATGKVYSFARENDVPKVEVHDPMTPHKELLTVYTDKDIHDVTALLVTLK
jgi:cytochrome c oxidase cbb3-type subunit III